MGRRRSACVTADAFVRARVDAEVPDDIRVAIWEKFLLVVPFGGLGAATRAPLGVLLTPPTRAVLERGMREIEAIARARGVALPEESSTHIRDSRRRQSERHVVIAARYCGREASELHAWTGAVVRLVRGPTCRPRCTSCSIPVVAARATSARRDRLQFLVTGVMLGRLDRRLGASRFSAGFIARAAVHGAVADHPIVRSLRGSRRRWRQSISTSFAIRYVGTRTVRGRDERRGFGGWLR